jgi:sugar phosphate isomerase/epimerase
MDTGNLRGRALLFGDGAKLIPGHNLDRVDVAAGLKALKDCGYDDMHTVMVIEHALMRWARGEEDAAERGAVDRSFYGIDLTSWYRVIAAARAAGEKAASGS